MCSLVAASVFLVILLNNQVRSEDSPYVGVDDSIPLMASGKRQHNIMRFGKRPAGGHNLIHFGKREDDDLDKRAVGLLDFLQKNRDSSFKRGHNIMRFGKREPGWQDNLDQRPENHSIFYPEKRATNGHSMMYFGKRDASDEDLEKRAHSMIHFGKREEDDEVAKRASHAMIHFGKRIPELWEKRQHNLLRFGKKSDRKGSHAMIHFGKRSVDRMKREISPVWVDDNAQDDDLHPPADAWNPSYYDEDPIYNYPYKKSSKNVFLRFG